jgi:hypothetical protein
LLDLVACKTPAQVRFDVGGDHDDDCTVDNRRKDGSGMVRVDARGCLRLPERRSAGKGEWGRKRGDVQEIWLWPCAPPSMSLRLGAGRASKAARSAAVQSSPAGWLRRGIAPKSRRGSALADFG